MELEQLVEECRAALAGSPERAIREIVARTIAEPAQLMAALGEPRRAGIQALHRSPELTVLNVVWAPGMSVTPHDHRVWAVIGIYTGREDNRFWRRLRDEAGGKIEEAGARTLGDREAVTLGRDIIHSVINPSSGFTGALHVYGGDFFAIQRSEWDPGTMLEHPYDVAKSLRLFEQANQS